MDRIKFENNIPITMQFKSNVPVERTENTKWGDKTYTDWTVETKDGQTKILSATSYLNDFILPYTPEAGTVLTITMRRANNKVAWEVLPGDITSVSKDVMIPTETPTRKEIIDTYVAIRQSLAAAGYEEHEATACCFIQTCKSGDYVREGTARDHAVPEGEEPLPF